MNSNEIKTEKLNLITWISQLQDISLIKKLKEFKISFEKEEDWYDLLSKTEKEDIEKANQSLREGKGISNEDAQLRIRKFIESKKAS